jgi:predicted nucleic acid binding AN1-type Zn finger protein
MGKEKEARFQKRFYKNKKIILAMVLAALVVLVAAIPVYLNLQENQLKARGSGFECKIDDDCVPASCCHASECIAVEKAPDCTGVMCSAVCEPGTLDCNQGHCACVKGECKAVIEKRLLDEK